MATQPQIGPPINVDVWAWCDSANHEVKFDHEWQVQGNPAKNKGRINVAPGQPATDITFQLTDDKTGLNLKFCDPASTAMYVGPAPNCPPPAGNGGQISYKLRTDKMLKVEDANSVAELLVYALRFEGDPNPMGKQVPPYVYDPELRNGGGGGLAASAISGSALTMTLLAIGVAAIVFIAYRLW